ncbi:MAG: hypothetical protein ACRCXB_07175 [Aeromonadaceae bacterium]
MRVKSVFRGYSMMREDCNQCGGFGCHWCLSEAELSELRQPTAPPDHTGDANEMVSCKACGELFLDGSQEAEFIGWHGKCAQCELESE